MEKLGDTLEMIKCNMAGGKYEIPLRDGGFYHLRGEKRAIDPADPTNVKVWFKIFCVRKIDYDRFFNGKLPIEQQINFMKNCGFHSLELIHNPELMKPKEVEANKKALEVKPSAEDIYREGRRKATISDVKAAQK